MSEFKENQLDTSENSSVLNYFETSIGDEIQFVKAQKSQGRGIVGFYCEFTPRDLIMAAGAIPICLCGTSQNTIPHAETLLPANLCPLIKSSFGYAITGGCPLLNDADLLVAETTCDGKKKMYELLAKKRKIHVLELTQKVNEQRAFELWLAEVTELKQVLEQTFDIVISDNMLSNAIISMNRERSLILSVQRLGMHKPSILSGLEIANTRYRVAGFEQHLAKLRQLLELADERIKTGYQAAPFHAPRVLLTGCPTGQGTLKVIEIVEQCGGVVVVQEACSGIKGVSENVDETGDPLTAIARKHFNIPCSCMTPNTGRETLLAQLAAEYQADVVIDLIWQACHTYNVESALIGDFVRLKLGLGYLKIETDYSDSDREQLKMRVQTLLELVQC